MDSFFTREGKNHSAVLHYPLFLYGVNIYLQSRHGTLHPLTEFCTHGLTASSCDYFKPVVQPLGLLEPSHLHRPLVLITFQLTASGSGRVCGGTGAGGLHVDDCVHGSLLLVGITWCTISGPIRACLCCTNHDADVQCSPHCRCAVEQCLSMFHHNADAQWNSVFPSFTTLHRCTVEQCLPNFHHIAQMHSGTVSPHSHQQKETLSSVCVCVCVHPQLKSQDLNCHLRFACFLVSFLLSMRKESHPVHVFISFWLVVQCPAAPSP